MARALVEFACEQQVLIFTCQPQTREILAAVDPDVGVHELGARTRPSESDKGVARAS